MAFVISERDRDQHCYTSVLQVAAGGSLTQMKLTAAEPKPKPAPKSQAAAGLQSLLDSMSKKYVQTYNWYFKNLLRVFFGRLLLNLPLPSCAFARQQWKDYAGAGPPYHPHVFRSVWRRVTRRARQMRASFLFGT